MSGIVWIILSVVFWGFWGLAGKVATRINDPMLVSVINGLISPAFSFVFWVLLVRNTAAGTLAGGGYGFLTICLATACGFIGSVCYYMALGQLPASYVVSLTAAYPAVTAVLAWLFLGETITLIQSGGILLIITGAVLVGYK